MNRFEDPIQFNEKIKIGDIEMIYSNLMEVSQGGPVVGDVLINGKKLQGRFGGPILHKGYCVYAPIQVMRFLGTGFKLAKINLNTLAIDHLGKTKFFIYLDRIEGNKIYYFEDMEKTIQKHYEL